MPWSSGTFTRANQDYAGSDVWQLDAAANEKIEAIRHDYHDQDLAAGINACLARDGSNAMLGPLDMGGFAITNISEAALDDEVPLYGQTIQSFTLTTKTLAGVRPSMANVSVDLTPVMDGAGTAVSFDTATNVLTLTKQNTAASTVSLSSLASANAPAWGPPKNTNFTAVGNAEYTIDASGGAIDATLPATITAGEYFTFHNNGSNNATVLRNGHTINYGGADVGDDILLVPGDTVSMVAISASALEII